jgi:CDP-diacylglycerol--glycerol-3-phosphate 3-phosphatidyltransferase
MGKSDRAFLFGALGLWLGLAGSLPDCGPVDHAGGGAGHPASTPFNRIRSGVRQARSPH